MLTDNCIRQNGGVVHFPQVLYAKPQSPYGRQLLSKGALDAGSRFLSPLLKEGGRRSLTGVWPAVLRQHKSDRQNGVAKPQSPYGRQLLSKGALDAGCRSLSPLLNTPRALRGWQARPDGCLAMPPL